jgi:hypothetical protein
MINLSNWRSVRLWESGLERQLHQRHRLWLHGWCIGLLVLAVMWAGAHGQMLLGSESLALRYATTLGMGYLAYLLLLRVWAASLLKRDLRNDSFSADLPAPDFGGFTNAPSGDVGDVLTSGGGGDFGGGGASGDFGSEGLGEVASGALEIAAGADEGVVVVVPVVAIFLLGLAIFMGAGSLLLLYFGWEALLTVAVELAFSYVSARAAVRVAREGWLSAAVRLTWKPLLGALCCAVLLGGVIDYFMPKANSLPQAVKLIRASR